MEGIINYIKIEKSCAAYILGISKVLKNVKESRSGIFFNKRRSLVNFAVWTTDLLLFDQLLYF